MFSDPRMPYESALADWAQNRLVALQILDGRQRFFAEAQAALREAERHYERAMAVPMPTAEVMTEKAA